MIYLDFISGGDPIERPVDLSRQCRDVPLVSDQRPVIAARFDDLKAAGETASPPIVERASRQQLVSRTLGAKQHGRGIERGRVEGRSKSDKKLFHVRKR